MRENPVAALRGATCGNDVLILGRSGTGALIIGAAATALGVPVGFALFPITLAGVALFRPHPAGCADRFGSDHALQNRSGAGGLGQHLLHEWVILMNLLGLLLGFALLSNRLEESRIPTNCRVSCTPTGRAPSCCWQCSAGILYAPHKSKPLTQATVAPVFPHFTS